MITPIGNFYNNRNFQYANKGIVPQSYTDKVSFSSDITRVCKTSNACDLLKIIKLFSLNYLKTNNNFKDISNKVITKIFSEIGLLFCGKDVIKEGNMVTYAIKRGDKVIGGAILKKIPDLKIADIKCLVIDKKYQCKKESVKSIYQIVRQIISECKNNNIEYVSWNVDNRDKIACNMYKKFAKEESSSNDIFSYWKLSLSELEKYMDALKKGNPKLLGDLQ